jgi:predicted Ser/Thr protein kinase
VEDPFSSNASLQVATSDHIEMSLTECIGHGASGQVFVGTIDEETYAVKIAPWKKGKQMLLQEAGIYEILSDLQGRCIPQVYGFFGSEHLKALIMGYMGHSAEKIADLSTDQRCACSFLASKNSISWLR